MSLDAGAKTAIILLVVALVFYLICVALGASTLGLIGAAILALIALVRAL